MRPEVRQTLDRAESFLGLAALVAVMLAAENAYFANGACWDVNGGLFMR